MATKQDLERNEIERDKTAEGFTLVEILFSTFTSLLVFAASI